MHARSARPERRIQHIFEAAQQVVGVEHGVFGDLFQAIRAMAHHIGKRAGKHAHLAMKGDHPAKAGFVMIFCRFFLDQHELPVPLLDKGQRRIGRQRFGEDDRP